MNKTTININGRDFPLYSLNTIVIGSGAAALNAAVNLFKQGQKDIAIVTDQWGGGTSNNAGSDKQTYYKLSLAGDSPDSTLQLAQDLFNGKCMHGDIALCEAQHSAQAFFHLVELGVPFPHDKYGGYIGYKTDNDSRGRGTSAGPLTSKFMFEALAKEVEKLSIPVFDQCEVIELLTCKDGGDKTVSGAVAIDKKALNIETLGFTIFNAVNVVLATGGPAGIFKESVYPECQTGASGLALKIGAVGQNLTEWQFGIASVKFRWNLSGSYQQVVPRYISTDQNGSDEREFLNEFFPDEQTLSDRIHLKGREWPFNVQKIYGSGTSLIDILVYNERVLKKRRVFLDYHHNNMAGKPVDRLHKLNDPAYELYKQHNIDLENEYLEIANCVQHNNGGLKGNIWWESNIKHLFPIGEVNGSHGVHRPGGAALNSGQVGGLRAAMYIAKNYYQTPPNPDDFCKRQETTIREVFGFAQTMLRREKQAPLKSFRDDLQERMSFSAGMVKDASKIDKASADAWQSYRCMQAVQNVTSPAELPYAFKNLDLSLTHAVYLEAYKEYLQKGGESRGSSLILRKEGEKCHNSLDDYWRFNLSKEQSLVDNSILEISLDDDMNIHKRWSEVRLIPKTNPNFEEVWKQYRNDRKCAGETNE